MPTASRRRDAPRDEGADAFIIRAVFRVVDRLIARRTSAAGLLPRHAVARGRMAAGHGIVAVIAPSRLVAAAIVVRWARALPSECSSLRGLFTFSTPLSETDSPVGNFHLDVSLGDGSA